MNNFRRQLKQPQRGATTVEFAVVAALLLVILFGILEYALIFLQEHYITNAAREGARVAVRANNFDCDDGNFLPGFTSCLGVASDRVDVTIKTVADYLSILYDADEIITEVNTIDLDDDNATKDDRVVQVRVEVDNPFTNITPQLLKLLRSGSNISHPDKISFEASMELENQEEFFED
jgi:hypothetical protein